jgi:hypothetical protein
VSLRESNRIATGFWVALFLVGAFLPAPASGASAYCRGERSLRSPFASSPDSDGSAESPHEICSLEQLHNASLDPDGHFVLMGNIYAGETRVPGPKPWQGDGGWIPLFTVQDPFTGVFDGNGYRIQNLKSRHRGADHVGLFGASGGAVFRNLVLRGLRVSGRRRVGTLVGLAGSNDAFEGTTIEDVHAEGVVLLSAPGERLYGAGGIAGEVGDYGTIRNSSFHGTIRSRDGSQVETIGGLAGRMGIFGRCESSRTEVEIELTTDGVVWAVGGVVGSTFTFNTVERCHASRPSIRIHDFDYAESIGGVVGNTGSRTTIRLVSSRRGSIVAQGASYVGGAVGRAYNTTIDESFASTAVTAGVAGGFIGNVGNSVYINDCYATGDVVADVAGGFLGSMEYECSSDIGNSYASGDVVGGSGFVGSVESNEGECPVGLGIFTSFSTGRSVNFSPRIYDRDAYFFRDNYWYSADAIDPQRCGPTFGPGECEPVSSPGLFQDREHPVFTAGAAPWDFESVWRAVPGRLPVLRELTPNRSRVPRRSTVPFGDDPF